MSYIENILDNIEKVRYKQMLDTFFVLLLSDQTFLIEIDESDRQHETATWLYSYKTFYDDIGYGTMKYPQGSISANRLLFSALKNYCSSLASTKQIVQNIRTGLFNFLKLRCDNSSQLNSSFMYGSKFEVERGMGIDGGKPRRNITSGVNFRHTSNALTLLFNENKRLDKNVELSYISMLDKLENLIDSDLEEKKYHISISSVLNTLESFKKHYPQHILIERTNKLFEKCKAQLLSEDCIEQDNGYDRWTLVSEGFIKFDYYLTFFTFNQYPYILREELGQSIVKNIIENNTIGLNGYSSIPTSPLAYLSNDEIKPDFSTTASLVSILSYCIDEQIGDNNWIEYCKTNIRKYLLFCLKYFDNMNVHQIIMLEGTCKVLLLPNIELSTERFNSIHNTINEFKLNIPHNVSNLEQEITETKDINTAFIIDFIQRWKIDKVEDNSVKTNRIDKVTEVLYNGTRIIIPIIRGIMDSFK